ncbi:uncharacterized protein LTR77_009835 [Saxophila tyrrhenica]|uniref:DUF1772-domain-containing protein n=1 Tax=Saxophila tyrrhenica TaxID=1690608 RepID=A0AAV9NZ71_9PEZI|nr:hypothetical protein LTR77_009835 [Saxophila tyrrhenica]
MDSLTIAKYISIPATFILTGYGISASQSTVPLLYKVPTNISAEVFKGVYLNGKSFVAPGAIISASALAYLAYAIPSQRQLYAAACGLILSTQVWTVGVMLPGINRIMEISRSVVEQQKADATGETVKLMKAWVLQNWVRAALSGASGLTALSAWVGGA